MSWNAETIVKRATPPATAKTGGKMRSSKTSAPKEAADLSVPAFLKRDKNNVSPATSQPLPEAKAKAMEATQERTPFDKPKGMSMEDYTAMKAQVDAPKEAAKAERLEALRARKPKKEKVEQPKGTFRLADWAKDEKKDPRHVRRVARTIKGELSKLYVSGMKYVFKDADKATVAKLIFDGFANETKKTVKVKKKGKVAAPSIPPPEETVWSGKAKKAKPGPAPKAIDPKGAARKVAKKAVKEHGKRNITKG